MKGRVRNGQQSDCRCRRLDMHCVRLPCSGWSKGGAIGSSTNLVPVRCASISAQGAGWDTVARAAQPWQWEAGSEGYKWCDTGPTRRGAGSISGASIATLAQQCTGSTSGTSRTNCAGPAAAAVPAARDRQQQRCQRRGTSSSSGASGAGPAAAAVPAARHL